jgi:lipoprotein-anchoring transpeptidase ErfK/SrfK
MTPDKPFLPRASRRTPIILILALLIVAALAGTVWAAWGAGRAAAWNPLGGLIAAAGADATATPTRTPRPETPEPTRAPVNLAIATVAPTATARPTAVPPPTSAPTVEPLLPHMIKVAERYGMDMARRFVVVDLASQTMTVWDPGEPARIMPVSTGDESRGYRTLSWYGLVGEYWGTFQASGVYADEGWYLFEDAGHILIHSTPYKVVNGRKVYEDTDALGAYPASKGCIRLAPEDAQWFTEWNPKGVPIVILPKDEGLGIN